ncbi:unnamed protein product [Phytomonas sp. EM1]|nr:unnamed protein product [Phytomonas sp. EM1]|eukprot:CCW64010.1 unnamed protein product [Phytomonas sp. isolate EM1]
MSDVVLLVKNIENLISFIETLLRKSSSQTSERSGVVVDTCRARFQRLQDRYHLLLCRYKIVTHVEIDGTSLPGNGVGGPSFQSITDAGITKEEPCDEGKSTFPCEPHSNSPCSNSDGLHINCLVRLPGSVSVFPNSVFDNEAGPTAGRESPLSVRTNETPPLGSSALNCGGSGCGDLCKPTDNGGGGKDSGRRPMSPSLRPDLPTSAAEFINAGGEPRNGPSDDGLEGDAPKDTGTRPNAPLQTLLQHFVAFKAGSTWRRFKSLPIPELAMVGDALHSPSGYLRDHRRTAAAEHCSVRANERPIGSQLRTSSSEDASVGAWQGHCAGCLSSLDAQSVIWRLLKFSFRGTAWFCHYTKRYYCQACHHGEVSPIPSRLLWEWDATPFAVCDAVKDFWVRYQDKPLFAVGAVNPSLYKRVPALDIAYALRVQIHALWEVCIPCADFRRLFYGDSVTDARDGEAEAACYVPLGQRYYLEDMELWSFADLLELYRCCPGPLHPRPKSLPCETRSPPARSHDGMEVGLQYFSEEDEERHERLALALSHTTNAGPPRQAQDHRQGHLCIPRDRNSMRGDSDAAGLIADALPSLALVYASCSVLQILHRVRQAIKWHLFQQCCDVCGYSRGCTTCQRHAADVCRLCCPADIAEDFLCSQVCEVVGEPEAPKRNQRPQDNPREQRERDTFACGKHRCGCGNSKSDCDRSFLSRLPEAVLPFFVLSIDILHIHICPRCGASYHKRCWRDAVSRGISDPCKVCEILPDFTTRQQERMNSENRT